MIEDLIVEMVERASEASIKRHVGVKGSALGGRGGLMARASLTMTRRAGYPCILLVTQGDS